jgi:hypothetical protein
MTQREMRTFAFALVMFASLHDGAYDIDFSRFGFTTRSAGEFPGAVAQIADVPASLDTSKLRDSLRIILSPGAQSFAVRMTAEMRGDSIVGI